MRGIILIVFGLVYLIYPNIFRRGIWLKTSISINSMTPEKHKIYMRVLGSVFLVIGIILLLKDKNIF